MRTPAELTEDIDRAKGFERAIHGPAHFGGTGHVRAQRERRRSGRFKLPLKSSSRTALRLASIATRAPMWLRLIAMSRPTPLEAPVIKTVLSRK